MCRGEDPSNKLGFKGSMLARKVESERGPGFMRVAGQLNHIVKGELRRWIKAYISEVLADTQS